MSRNGILQFMLGRVKSNDSSFLWDFQYHSSTILHFKSC
ncbi:unnamed protein product [Prunus brigantina]